MSGEDARDLQQGRRNTRANIGDPRTHTGCGGRPHVGPGDVVDRNEIPRLLPVAEDRHAFAVAIPPVEDRDHPAVRRRRILPRTEHVEIALATHRKTKRRAVPEQDRLRGQLRTAVGRNRALRRFLMNRPLRGVAVDRGRRGKHHPRHRVTTRDFSDLLRSGDIEPVVQIGVLHAVLHAHEGCQMNDRARLHFPCQRVQRARAGHIEFVKGECRVGPRVGEIGPAPRAEIIHADHFVAFRQKAIHGVATDETRRTRYDNTGHSSDTLATRPFCQQVTVKADTMGAK